MRFPQVYRLFLSLISQRQPPARCLEACPWLGLRACWLSSHGSKERPGLPALPPEDKMLWAESRRPESRPRITTSMSAWFVNPCSQHTLICFRPDYIRAHA